MVDDVSKVSLGIADYSGTLFLPQTSFTMRLEISKTEKEILEFWKSYGLYDKLREASKDSPTFVLHDGPPYANGHIHMGHALNKILKDIVVKSKQMAGYNANYVPGWDCHGLPIEWKVEEENYIAKGKEKPNLHDRFAVISFRNECREYAEYWVNKQSEEFQILGLIGDFNNSYKTMDFSFEANITSELHKFAMAGQIYRAYKPVMWSVVEGTALAEAEIEYLDYLSDSIYVKFPVINGDDFLSGASILIWTTTPWTIPGNRAICYSDKLSYGMYLVSSSKADINEKLISVSYTHLTLPTTPYV